MADSLRKTTRDYWDKVWTGQADGHRLDPESSALVRHYDRSLHRMIEDAFRRWGERPRTLIELGCGGSVYLPYFLRYHGLEVAGLDYSEAGCASSRQQLAAHGVTGDIVQGDVFDLPPSLAARFDVAFSMGLFEHFTDTAAIVKAGAATLRPGGLMITVVPNMTGLPGALQRFLDPDLFAMHVPLDTHELAEAHRAAGLEILDSGYLMTVNPHVLHCRNEASAFGVAFRLLRAALARLVWGIEGVIGRGFPNAVTSPYVFCFARRP